MVIKTPTEAEALRIQQANFALSNQNPREAERIAGEVIKLNPGAVSAMRIYGNALLMQGRARDAIDALEPAASDLKDSEIDFQLAYAFRQVGRNEDAILRLEEAIKRQPPFPPAFYELSTLLSLTKRYHYAIDVLKIGIQSAPATPELSIQLGFIYLEIKDYGSAKFSFTKALDVSKNVSPYALSGMGKALQGLGEHNNAIQYFRRCLMHAPNDGGVLLDLALSLLETRDVDAAYEALRAVAPRDQKRYFQALSTLLRSSRGRFWLRPSQAKMFLQRKEN